MALVRRITLCGKKDTTDLLIVRQQFLGREILSHQRVDRIERLLLLPTINKSHRCENVCLHLPLSAMESRAQRVSRSN